jgi:glycerate kinase
LVTEIFVGRSGLGHSSIALVAMDKFRGTASARDLCNAVVRALQANNFVADLQPMSDGGEGFRDAFAGEEVVVEVPGPLGAPVDARITLDDSSSGRRAVLEIAEVVGRDQLVSPTRREALDASSAGVGHLIVNAVELGATSILIGCGGSATSDGGLGCYRVLRAAGGLVVPVSVATDVTARFSGLLRYAEQKGVHPDDLVELEQRLMDMRALYLKEQGVDVELLERSGASGGIPAALAALGASLTNGFEVVASSVNLLERIEQSSLIITGEGRLDAGSLEGKVTSGVASMVGEGAALLVVCGSVEREAALAFQFHFPNARIVSLVELFGEERAMADALACVEIVVAEETR